MNLIKERGGCNVLPGSIFVQSLQMKRWINSIVWTTVAHQPPTLTTLPRRAPLAPPTLLPTHTCTRTLTRINTLPLCQPPAKTRLPKHTGPTGTHNHHLSSAPSTIIHLMFPLPFPLSFSCSFNLSSLIIKVRETQWLIQVCLCFSSGFVLCSWVLPFQALFHVISLGSWNTIVSLIALLLSINSDTLEIKKEIKTIIKRFL